jgi:hypothetical protein
MSEAIIKASDAAAWLGKSLVDATISESGNLIILKNSSGSAVGVAGINDDQQLGDTKRVINRGADAINFVAEDTTAQAKDRFLSAGALAAGQSIFLFYNGLRWEPYLEA